MTQLDFVGRKLFGQKCVWVRWAIAVAAGLVVVGEGRAIAQSFPPCPGPAVGEYLLLARGNTATDRDRIAAALPASNPVLVCHYDDEVVVRAGGFEDLESANSWALYLSDIEGVETFVAQPASLAEAADDASEISFRPQALAAGYAVLVDYDNQPDVAATATNALVRPVGLAVYRQRPYLLAAHTADAETAAMVLQQLTAVDLSVILVESQQVVRLLETVTID